VALVDVLSAVRDLEAQCGKRLLLAVIAPETAGRSEPGPDVNRQRLHRQLCGAGRTVLRSAVRANYSQATRVGGKVSGS
jgi:hypothetical protein